MRVLEDLHAFLWSDPNSNNANTYLIEGSKRVLVDPGHEHLFGFVRAHLEELDLTPDDIDVVVATHAHPDHVESLRFFFSTRTLIAFPALELEFVRTEAPQYAPSLGLSDFEPPILLREGVLEVGDLSLHVYHTPGHSPGSVCIYWPERKVLLTGDVVFYQSVGRTDLPGGSGEDLRESIQRLSRLEVEYLLPGHGEVITGRDLVNRNFQEIVRMLLTYL